MGAIQAKKPSNQGENAKSKVVRSPIYRLGDKYKIAQQLISMMPDKINNFYDVFGGGGTILANVVAKKFFYNDSDERLTDLVEFLYMSKPDEVDRLIRRSISNFEIRMSPFARVEKAPFMKLRNFYNIESDKRSPKASVLLLNLAIHSFNSQIRFNSKGEFNTPPGKQTYNSNRRTNLLLFCERLKHRKIGFSSLDFESFVFTASKRHGSFFYFDPPYSGTMATYNSSWSSSDDFRLFSLLDQLNSKKIPWGLSNVLTGDRSRDRAILSWIKEKSYILVSIRHTYLNSNYQRKSSDFKEIYVTNYVKKRVQ